MPPVISPVEGKIMLDEYRIPTITAYNRLEPVPRSKDPENSLKADVRDALWMLTRQWQYGEFRGEDAGSAVTAQILGEHTAMDRIQLGDADPAAYDPGKPLEATVEAEELTDNLFFAVQIARYFIRLLQMKSLDTTYTAKFIAQYPLNFAIDPNDQNGLQLNLSVQTKSFNGSTLLSDILTPQGGSTKFANWLQSQGFPASDQTTLNGLAKDLTDWYSRNYFQPAGANKAWESSQLEYKFEIASPPEAPGQKFLSANQFYGGHLDWYSFDLDSSGSMSLKPEPSNPPLVKENLVSFIPAPVSFKGMPSPRYWTMDDSQLDFGKIDASPTGLLHLLMAEFALVYGNDWFMLPYPLPVNTLCEIKGLIVTDVFGENTLISPAGSGSENNWQRWTMFHQTDVNPAAADTRTTNHLFYLCPSITHSLQDDPMEEVNFLRDQMAGMVWAVENRVPSQAGKGVSGDAMALKSTQPPPFTPAPGNAAIRYILGTTVPDNWIPFIPVHISGSITEIRFQRAAMPGAKGALGRIISETPAPYYVNEEEIPRSGILVSRNFNRTRWINGKTFLWIGRSKDAGTGEGWSNLKFDQIVPIQQAKNG